MSLKARIFPTIASSFLLATPALAQPQIGVTMTAFNNPFLTILLNGIKDQAAQTGASLQIEDAQLDVGRQINQVQNFIANDVDAIIVNAVDGDSTMAMTKMATEAGVPIVYVNHPPIDIDSLPDTATFVGSNELDSGTMQTQEVCRLLGGTGQVLVLMGPPENHAAHTRTKDIEDVLETDACSGLEIVDKQVANWSRLEGQDRMTNWLTAGIEFDAVIANNDEMAIGAIQALKIAGSDMDDIVVAGIDATPDGLTAMQAGDLDITVFQNARRQGAVALDAALAMSEGTKHDDNLWVPFELVTPQNIDNYQN